METIIAIGAAHALYLSFLLVSKKKKGLADFILIVLLLLLTGTFGLVFLSFEWDTDILQAPIWNISLLIAPMFYFYAASLMTNQVTFKRSWFLHLLPYLCSSIYMLYVFIFYPEPLIDELFQTGTIVKEFSLFNFFLLLDFLAIPFYIFLLFSLLKEHELKISDVFSNLENRDLQWLKFLLIGILGIWFVINGFVYLSSAVDDFSILYGFSIATIFIFYIGHNGIKQSAIFTAIHIEEEQVSLSESKKYEKSALKAEEIKKHASVLVDFMKKEKSYIDSDLNLYELAKSVDISTHNLSQLLNKEFNQSFYEFINTYRVTEFKNRISKGDHQQFTILSIALESGFNSKSSFNRVFKKMTGLTPLQFIKTEEDK